MAATNFGEWIISFCILLSTSGCRSLQCYQCGNPGLVAVNSKESGALWVPKVDSPYSCGADPLGEKNKNASLVNCTKAAMSCGKRKQKLSNKVHDNTYGMANRFCSSKKAEPACRTATMAARKASEALEFELCLCDGDKCNGASRVHFHILLLLVLLLHFLCRI